MAVRVADVIKPMNDQDFPVVNVEHLGINDELPTADDLGKVVKVVNKGDEEHPNYQFDVVDGGADADGLFRDVFGENYDKGQLDLQQREGQDAPSFTIDGGEDAAKTVIKNDGMTVTEGDNTSSVGASNVSVSNTDEDGIVKSANVSTESIVLSESGHEEAGDNKAAMVFPDSISVSHGSNSSSMGADNGFINYHEEDGVNTQSFLSGDTLRETKTYSDAEGSHVKEGTYSSEGFSLQENGTTSITAAVTGPGDGVIWVGDSTELSKNTQITPTQILIQGNKVLTELATDADKVLVSVPVMDGEEIKGYKFVEKDAVPNKLDVTAAIGSDEIPVYVNEAGVITAAEGYINVPAPVADDEGKILVADAEGHWQISAPALTDAEYATKIGSSEGTEAIGSETLPVYVAEDGTITAVTGIDVSAVEGEGAGIVKAKELQAAAATIQAAADVEDPSFIVKDAAGLPQIQVVPAGDNKGVYIGSSDDAGHKVATMADVTNRWAYKVVEALPATGEEYTIYLVPATEGGQEEEQNVHAEYIWIVEEEGGEGKWEKIGDTRIDLSDYYTKEEVDDLLAGDLYPNSVTTPTITVRGEGGGEEERFTASTEVSANVETFSFDEPITASNVKLWMLDKGGEVVIADNEPLTSADGKLIYSGAHPDNRFTFDLVYDPATNEGTVTYSPEDININDAQNRIQFVVAPSGGGELTVADTVHIDNTGIDTNGADIRIAGTSVLDSSTHSFEYTGEAAEATPTNVEDALNDLYSKVSSMALDIVDLKVEPETLVAGIETEIVVSWRYNKPVTSQTLTVDGEAVEVEQEGSSFVVTVPGISARAGADLDIAVEGHDADGNEAYKTITLAVKSPIVFGSAPRPVDDVYDDSFLGYLSGQLEADGKDIIALVYIDNEQYGYIAYPFDWGDLEYAHIGGMQCEMVSCGSVYSEEFGTLCLYRTTRPSLGRTNIQTFENSFAPRS
ncbi:MAG: hypothetical protein MJZ34_03135 [Paludibacteraceae bacterium]|nr:hypothetical protein [Paludibacteraceae bacterium]